MSSTKGDQFGEVLQGLGYHAAVIQPLLPMYLHIILSALFPIFTGAHASLSRPSSAEKPPRKSKKHSQDGDDGFEGEQKMEGLSPMDAILFPVLGGLTLAGLYYIIKYLEDPAILNIIMNWYFAAFGVLSLARLLTDTMVNIWSIVFPDIYQQDGEIWKIDRKARKVWATKKTQLGRDSPLPGYLALLPLPMKIGKYLWTVKEVPSHKLRIQAYVHKNLKADFNIGPFDLTGLAIAIAVELYFNLIDKPWWLTNLLGFSFSYAALQIMSPTTAWTGTLILGGLFFYDIFFVFFTPMMVTVATKIDIPAKLLFPRPEAEGMSMLGLGDVVLPGMIIGFALRFDLFLFYLRKQTNPQKPAAQRRSTRSSRKDDGPAETEEADVIKAKWIPATGGWGERLWTMGASKSTIVGQGGNFSKSYFYATVTGYVLGLMITLIVMQVFGHAQPALLYLVPGVLGALWATALVKGELEILWNFSEDEDQEDKKGGKRKGGEGAERSANSDWMDWSVIGRITKKIEEEERRTKGTPGMSENAGEFVTDSAAGNSSDNGGTGQDSRDAEKSQAKPRKWDGKLVSFSISLPQPPLED